ncbi:MAG: glycerophosphodiester phosphodiesterase family protein [Pyrinomonadaceae bacterium]
MLLPLIIGHRGASALAPENTLIAFTKAFDDGADGLEFDVHLARDGVPVIIHDDTLKRTGLRAGRIADLTSKELAQIDVGTWFNRKFPARAHPSYASATIPTLVQLFELVHKRRPVLYVELKGPDAIDLAAPVTRLIAEYDLKANAIVESFSHAAVKQVKLADPTIRTAALFEPTLTRPKPSAGWLLERAKECDADEIALHYSMASRRVVTHLADYGTPVVIWTADKPSWVGRAVRDGIGAIITNNPEVLVAKRATLRQFGQ